MTLPLTTNVKDNTNGLFYTCVVKKEQGQPGWSIAIFFKRLAPTPVSRLKGKGHYLDNFGHKNQLGNEQWRDVNYKTLLEMAPSAVT